MIRAAERRGIEQDDAAVSRGGGDDFLTVVAKDRRAGDEIRIGLREPVLRLQRLRIERDDRAGLAVPGRLASADAATSVPSCVNATAPTTSPPLVFHDTTGFASLSRSIAHTALGAPPQFPDVAVYIVVPTAIGADQRELAGTNCAGFCMSLPDGRPSDVQHAVARDDVGDPRRPEQEAEGTAGAFFHSRRAGNTLDRLSAARRGNGRRRSAGAAALGRSGIGATLPPAGGAHTRRISCPSPAARTTLGRHAFTGFAEQASISDHAAARLRIRRRASADSRRL